MDNFFQAYCPGCHWLDFLSGHHGHKCHGFIVTTCSVKPACTVKPVLKDHHLLPERSGTGVLEST